MDNVDDPDLVIDIESNDPDLVIDIASPAPASPCVEELRYLVAAKLKILKALSKGASVVSEIEIRGRIIKHRDLLAELAGIKTAIVRCENEIAGRNPRRPARTKARLGYGRRC